MPALDAASKLSADNCRMVSYLDKFFADNVGGDIDLISKGNVDKLTLRDLPSFSGREAFTYDNIKANLDAKSMYCTVDWEKKLNKRGATIEEFNAYLESYESVIRMKVTPDDLKGSSPLAKFYKDASPPSSTYLGVELQVALGWLGFVGQIDEKLAKAQKSVAEAQKKLDDATDVPKDVMEHIRKKARDFEGMLRVINNLMVAADLEMREMTMGFKRFAQDMTVAYKELYEHTAKMLSHDDLDPAIKAKLKKSVEAVRSDISKMKG